MKTLLRGNRIYFKHDNHIYYYEELKYNEIRKVDGIYRKDYQKILEGLGEDYDDQRN